jgi:hypothetical protein
MTQLKQWRGLKALFEDAVEYGSRAVERVHMETARRPFHIIEHIPGVEVPTRMIHLAHDATVTTTYAMIRLVNRAVSAALGATLDVLDARQAASEGADQAFEDQA